MKNYKYYIHHKKYGPLRIIREGGWTCPHFDGFLEGLADITFYKTKKLAKEDLEFCLLLKTAEYKKLFSIKKI